MQKTIDCHPFKLYDIFFKALNKVLIKWSKFIVLTCKHWANNLFFGILNRIRPIFRPAHSIWYQISFTNVYIHSYILYLISLTNSKMKLRKIKLFKTTLQKIMVFHSKQLLNMDNPSRVCLSTKYLLGWAFLFTTEIFKQDSCECYYTHNFWIPLTRVAHRWIKSSFILLVWFRVRAEVIVVESSLTQLDLYLLVSFFRVIHIKI